MPSLWFVSAQPCMSSSWCLAVIFLCPGFETRWLFFSISKPCRSESSPFCFILLSGHEHTSALPDFLSVVSLTVPESKVWEEEFDLNSVRLCFQAKITLPTGELYPLEPVVSQPIYDNSEWKTSLPALEPQFFLGRRSGKLRHFSKPPSGSRGREAGWAPLMGSLIAWVNTVKSCDLMILYWVRHKQLETVCVHRRSLFLFGGKIFLFAWNDLQESFLNNSIL